MRRNKKSFLSRSFVLVLSGLFVVSVVLVRADSSITELSAAEEKALKEKQDRLDEIRDKIKAWMTAIDESDHRGLREDLDVPKRSAREASIPPHHPRVHHTEL
jgi:hypothetical protein